MRKKISNFTFEKFVFFLFLFALALIFGSSAEAQTIISDSSNILEIKASSTPTKSIFKFLPSTSANSFSLQAIAETANPATTISVFEYLSSNSLFKMLNGVLNFNPSAGSGTGYIGVGTTNPGAKLQISHNVTSSNWPFIIEGYKDGSTPIASIFLMRGARGTMTSPTAIQSGDIVSQWSVEGYGATGFANTSVGRLKFGAEENFTNTTKATYLSFDTTPSGSTSGVERLRITGSGNVGIGTTTPEAKLVVSGGNIFITDASINSGTPHAAITKTYLDSSLETYGSKWILNGSKLYASSTAWNVGIGTTNPSYKLQVDGVLGVKETSGTNGTRAIIFADDDGAYYTMDGNSAKPIIFRTWKSGSETMRINTNGNVGIGTDAPGAFRLFVNGATYTSGNLNVGGDATISGGDVSISNNNGGINFNDASAYWLKTATNYGIYWDTTANQFKFNGAGVTKASIDLDDGAAYFNGSVGIGTVSPNALLDIYNGALVNTTPKSNHYRNVYSNYLGDGTVTGTLKVVLPKMAPSTMIDITIKGYDYRTNLGAWEVRVSGYVYGSDGWYSQNHKAQIIGSAPFDSVRLGTDGAKPVILLGNTGTKWSYGNIEVSDVTTSYNSIKDWGTDWSSAVLTSESGITISATPLISTYVTSAGNFGIGTTAPETALDVNGLIKMRNSAISTSSDVINKGYLDSALSAVTASSVSGLTLTSAANGINPDNVTQNQLGYNTSVSLFNQNDGGLYSSAYSSAWIHQIYGDFRTGQIAVRGKNNGTWQPWRIVLDSANNVSSAGNLMITGAGPHYIQNGNVGIGTKNPLSRLYVFGSARNPFVSGTDPRSIASFVGDTKDGLYIGAFADPLKGLWLQASDSNDLSVKYPLTLNPNGGNVGIGTSAPNSALHVQGSSYLNGTIQTALTGTGSRCLHVDASGVIGTMAGDCGTSTGGDNLGNGIASTNIALGNYWLSGDGGSEGIFVKSDGNVGVGTTNPGTNKLYVNGTTTINGALNVAGTATTTIAGNTMFTTGVVGIGVSRSFNDGTKFHIGLPNGTNQSFIKFGYNNGPFIDTLGRWQNLGQEGFEASDLIINPSGGAVIFGPLDNERIFITDGTIYNWDSSQYINLKGTVLPNSILVSSDIVTTHGSLKLPYTTNTATPEGIIFKQGNRFIHDFNYGVVGNGAVTIGKNTFVGINAGNLSMGSTATSNYHSSYNTGIGVESLYSNTTGYENTAIGINSLTYNNTGAGNTANGAKSLYSNTTGNLNTANGSESLYSNTTGSHNTAIGRNSLKSNTTGLTNVAVGSGSGQSNITGSSNVFLGANANPASSNNQNSIVIGSDAQGAGSNSVVLGNDYINRTYLRGNVGINYPAYTSLSYTLDVIGDIRATGFVYDSSDERIKHDIKSLDNTDYQKILKLRPVSFFFNSDNRKGLGFIAQEVEKIYPEIVSTDQQGGMKSVSYINLISPAIVAIQEQQKKIDEQDTLIHILLDRVNKLEKK